MTRARHQGDRATNHPAVSSRIASLERVSLGSESLLDCAKPRRARAFSPAAGCLRWRRRGGLTAALGRDRVASPLVRHFSLASLVAVAALVVLPWALPGKAGAATQLGQVSPPFPLLSPSGNFVQLQTATIPYTVPFPGGVITGWSHMGTAEDGSAGSGRLQLWRQVGMTTDFFLVGRSNLEPFTAGIVNPFSTRVPVSGGELLGLRGEDAGSTYGGMAGDNELELELLGGDPAPGETRSAVGAADPVTLVNVSAVLEPDADRDGFGDETQDQCPTSATTQGPCPTTAPTTAAVPTGQRAAAIKKCKKKFPGKAKAKKRKKCIKKAKKPPV